MSDPIERTEGTEVPKAGGTVTLPNGKAARIRVFKDVKIRQGTTRFSLPRIQLVATGENVSGCRWLQFVYRIRKNGKGEEVPGTYPATLYQKYGIEGRHVDSSVRGDPFYDAGGESNRTDAESSIFDVPSVDPETGIVETRAIFDAFLICGGKVVYHVHWERVGKRNDEGDWERAYDNISGEATDGLPEYARGDELLAGFRRRRGDELSRPRNFDNPVHEDCRVPSDEREEEDKEDPDEEKKPSDDKKAHGAVREATGALNEAVRPVARPVRVEIFYVDEGMPRRRTPVPLLLTLEAGGTLHFIDGQPVPDDAALQQAIVRLAKSLRRRERLVVDLYFDGPEAERLLSTSDLARGAARIRTALRTVVPRKRVKRATIHLHSSLLAKS